MERGGDGDSTKKMEIERIRNGQENERYDRRDSRKKNDIASPGNPPQLSKAELLPFFSASSTSLLGKSNAAVHKLVNFCGGCLTEMLP
jgi:hypothetical protein